MPSCFPRSVTFYKLSAVTCAESSFFWPEPEYDLSTDDEPTPKFDLNREQKTAGNSLSLNNFSLYQNQENDGVQETSHVPEEIKSCEIPQTNGSVEHQGGQKKTLVLDLDETLISATTSESLMKILNIKDYVNPSTISFLDQNGGVTELEFYVRPGVQSLLRTMSIYYDIIVTLPFLFL